PTLFSATLSSRPPCPTLFPYTTLFRSSEPEMKNMRWHAIKVLEQDETVLKRHPVDTKGIVDRSYEKDIINEKYDFIEEVIDEVRSEEHTSELQSRFDIVCRLLLDTENW